MLSNRATSINNLDEYLLKADWIFHLAGTNRPKDEKEFIVGNVNTTKYITEFLTENGKSTPIVFSSSIQAEMDNPYGKSKNIAENILLNYQNKTKANVYIFRLPNVYGKFAKPNYNSVVATFCHNISRSMPIEIHDPNKIITLVSVDHIIEEFESLVNYNKQYNGVYYEIHKENQISIGELARIIQGFKDINNTNAIDDPFINSLYNTYLSYNENSK